MVVHYLLLADPQMTSLGMYLKEKLEEAMLGAKQLFTRDYRTNRIKFINDIQQGQNKYFQKMMDRFFNSTGQKIATFISTGNVVSSTGLDLMQVTGYTIVAERLNYLRYLSHFQSVHRGQFFTTMKTTTVRKLLPESWGYLCPVHTPDGSPCGLLNHLAVQTAVCTYPPQRRPVMTIQGAIAQPSSTIAPEMLCSRRYITQLMVYLGMLTSGANNADGQVILSEGQHVSMLLDGVPIGGIKVSDAPRIVSSLRMLKARSLSHSSSSSSSSSASSSNRGNDKRFLEASTEIAFVPPAHLAVPGLSSSSSSSDKGGDRGTKNVVGTYPGLYLFTQPGRFLRPVFNLQQQSVEYIGPLEQVYLNIACLPAELAAQNASKASQEAKSGLLDLYSQFTHLELSPCNILSQVASLTPYSDYNQSPRNMYQCQMGKQTMGTPAHAWKSRTDNKLYRILNIQAPVVQNAMQQAYAMDEYPQGCNAVVAVISYTGKGLHGR
jgi:DNA-directed RNA polymerase I subunit RPA2